ncbi:hypothetical protein GIB67_017972 [Kingdonia uniflora]|uniref:Uncharacterized protein n=1 Tax=Kingdonia uniflora TaxID=39325 RepID=A0A7J7MIH5_9MAGN|nr:hypothetical protein GIB67_017972 [Kingdonia uniflora]
MNFIIGFELCILTKSPLFNTNLLFSLNGNNITSIEAKILTRSTSMSSRGRNLSLDPKSMFSRNPTTRNPEPVNPISHASSMGTIQVEQLPEVEIAEGYTITQFCDKIIDVFLYEKPQTKDWKKLLVFREDWNKYRESFYGRCRSRADIEHDPAIKQKFIVLGRKVKKIDHEMEIHAELLKEIEQYPTDINAVVARRRKDFTGEFFRHLTLLAEVYEGLEDRDAVARLGARCLSAVYAYDNTVENTEMLDIAQSKFDDILNSPSLDVACEKIKSLAKAKELDSSLILLINSAWAAAKESTAMKNEVKDIMYHLYQATKSSLRSMAPKEIKLLKYLLNITDPEERFSALAMAFSPGDESAPKDPNALYTKETLSFEEVTSTLLSEERRLKGSESFGSDCKAGKDNGASSARGSESDTNKLATVTSNDGDEALLVVAADGSRHDRGWVFDSGATTHLIFIFIQLFSWNSSPKELQKWIMIMLNAYQLNLEETEMREAKQLSQPVVIQRLFILKQTIEEEYLKQHGPEENDNESQDF